MGLIVTLELPPDVERKLRLETPDLESDVRQTYALDLFRRGIISHLELANVLRLDRYETDALLKRSQIFEGSPTMADLESDASTLEQVMNRP